MTAPDHPRYKVAVCVGYPITQGAPGSYSRAGLTASVLDTWNAHREVRRFRSEDLPTRTYLRERRNAEARRLAIACADELNAGALESR